MKWTVFMAGMLVAARAAPVADPAAFNLGAIAIPAITGSALLDGLLLGKVAFLKAAILANLLLDQGGEEATVDSYGAPADTYGAPVDSYGAPAESYGAPADSYGAPANDYSAPAVSYEAAAPSYEAPVAQDSYGSPAADPVDNYGSPAAAPISYNGYY